MEVGVRELRDNLSKWIGRARKGHDIVITDRGRPVARLTRYGTSPALRRLIEQGRVQLPARQKAKIDRKRLIKPRDGVSELVTEQRR